LGRDLLAKGGICRSVSNRATTPQLAVKDRTQLALENSALRQQLAVYKRSVKRPNINDGDRIFWMTIMRFLREWKEAVVIVKPETVVKWHRKGSSTTGDASHAASPVGSRSSRCAECVIAARPSATVAGRWMRADCTMGTTR
jgi:hypothetical protein